MHRWTQSSEYLFQQTRPLNFTCGYDLRNGHDPALDLYPQFSYPACCEMDGMIHIIYTMQTPERQNHIRGAMLTSIPVEIPF